jgi:anti-anti-sigma factor
MSDDTLSLRLQASQQGPVVWVAGRLSDTTMETFLRLVAAALRIRGARAVVLELAEVHYIDVAGVAALLECRRLARALGRDLILGRLSRQVLAGIRACAAGSLLADRIGRRRCSMRKRRRPLPRSNRTGRGFCGQVPRGRRSTSSPAVEA